MSVCTRNCSDRPAANATDESGVKLTVPWSADKRTTAVRPREMRCIHAMPQLTCTNLGLSAKTRIASILMHDRQLHQFIILRIIVPAAHDSVTPIGSRTRGDTVAKSSTGIERYALASARSLGQAI